MAVNTTWESPYIGDFLKADPFAQEIRIKYHDATRSYPIMNRKSFFSEIYTDIQDGKLEVKRGDESSFKKREYREWLREIVSTNNSLVIFIEGYAGCGKTIFVQKFLKDQLNTLDYDFNYYNYDIGAYFENHGTQRIKSAIAECFIQQLEECVLLPNHDTINKFKELSAQKQIEYIDSSYEIYYCIAGANSFDHAVNYLRKTQDSETFRKSMHEQMKSLNLEQVLAIDYILRIAKYITSEAESNLIYICYDNMDAIENFDELVSFDNTLASIRRNIGCYLNNSEDNFGAHCVPYFIILATYRKITASKVDLRQHSERSDDFSEDSRFIYYIDLSCAYDYKMMIRKRRNYYSKYVKYNNIDANALLKKLNEVVLLTNTNLITKRFSNIWNNNYRTSSDIIQLLFVDYHSEITMCINLLKNQQDGYDEEYFSHLGASAVFMNLICKVFATHGLWGHDCASFIPRGVPEPGTPTAQLSSLPRLILTFIANAKDVNGVGMPVSTREIFREFDSLFSPDDICSCLADMLTRDERNKLRRPIYYHRNAISDNDQIKQSIKDQWITHHSGEINASNNYTEFLLCECGYAFVERIFSEFEFFSVAVHGVDRMSLYLLDDQDMIINTIDGVLEAVERCCLNSKLFQKRYEEAKNDVKTSNSYVAQLINPRTFSGSPQLYAERAIFSHISYLDHCRRFYIIKSSDEEQQRELNIVFIERMEKYLSLYLKYIKPLDSSRTAVVEILEQKIQSSRKAPCLKGWLKSIHT